MKNCVTFIYHKYFQSIKGTLYCVVKLIGIYHHVWKTLFGQRIEGTGKQVVRGPELRGRHRVLHQGPHEEPVHPALLHQPGPLLPQPKEVAPGNPRCQAGFRERP